MVRYSGAMLSKRLLYDSIMSVSKRDSTGESHAAQNTWGRRFKQRCEREGWEGEKISTDSFLLITHFYYYFNWIKFLSFLFIFLFLFFFLTFGLKMFFNLFDQWLRFHFFASFWYLGITIAWCSEVISLFTRSYYSTETTSCWQNWRSIPSQLVQ